MDIMQNIQARQIALAQSVADPQLPLHRPEMLYIGCIDARLDPIEDIGIEKGRALIFRNIAALVLPDSPDRGTLENRGATGETGSAPENISIGAVLEFFLRYIPPAASGVKHIVISGHTDCGGLKACQGQICQHGDRHLPLYLKNLDSVLARVKMQSEAGHWNETEFLHALEKEAVRNSLNNLLGYPIVADGVRNGTVAVHGWVIDTGTQRISCMNPQTGEFEPLADSALPQPRLNK